MESHETARVLNPGDAVAELTLTIYFSNREPAGSYHAEVQPRWTLRPRYNDLQDAEPVPLATPTMRR